MFLRYKRSCFCLGFFGLIACGKSPHQSSDLQVTNGISIGEEEFPAVVLVMKDRAADKDGLPLFCTATFINDHQALTAAHCLGDPAQADAPLFIMQPELTGDGGVPEVRAVAQAVRAHVHPQYEPSRTDELSSFDLAVLDFPTGTAPSSLNLGTASPPLNSKVTLVGYGTYEALSGGNQSARRPSNKRYGNNTVRSSKQGFLSLTGLTHGRDSLPQGQQVATASGDSGSPWLHDGQLVSVTVGSKIQRLAQGKELNLTYAVDLHSPSSKDFLNNTID